MSSLIEAKAGMRTLGTKAQEVANDSTLSSAEKMTRLEAYSTEMKGYSDIVSVHEAAQRLVAGGESAPEAKAADREVGTKTFGEQIISSNAFKSAAGAKGGQFAFSSEIGTKVAGIVDEGTTITNGQLNGAAGVLALPNYQPGIVDLRFAALNVAQLFAQGATDSPIISYVKESAETDGSAPRAEKTPIGQSDATVVRVNEQVGGIAAFYKVTTEMLQDIPQFQSFLSSRLVAQIGRKEEDGVLNGAGFPGLGGILGRAGLQTAISAGTTGTLAKPTLLAEAIHKQVTAIRTTAFVEPDAVVMNPLDWEKIQLATDANGQYFSGGPFSGSYGNGGFSNVESLWGLRVVQSPRISSGNAIVGAFNEGGQLFRRQGVTVEMTNSNEDDFKNGLVMVRATTRSALAIWRPGAFGKVTVTWA